ncbi:MAG: hypothetical protein IJ729_06910, partial [Alloprevotella sp.]|nr:hypothetical protein [Alloprevotella sp.]
PWSYFLNIVDDVETGIESPSVSSDRSSTVFNLQGQRINNLQRGQVVIVRYSDGTSKKVLVQ